LFKPFNHRLHVSIGGDSHKETNMSEKTPRQIAAKAEVFYADHKTIAPVLEAVSQKVEHEISQVQRFHNLANALESGKEAPGRDFTLEEDIQRRRIMRDHTAEWLGKSVMKQGELIQESGANLRKAAKHYKKNAAGYYELGVHEAALDGVYINVQQPQSTEAPNSAE
jgi:hypothetical protein